MPFHLVHIISNPDLHILNGYNEVIKTLFWGLRSFDNDVSYAVNTPREDAVNIVFGANMAHSSQIHALPANSIIYNLEQVGPLLDNLPMRRAFQYLSQKFKIWDYSEKNVESWKIINPDCNPVHVPIGFAPILETIPTTEAQDIDILFYGGPSAERLSIFTELCFKGVSAVFCFGLYDAARDGLIARSKLVLNISQSHADIFSIVRVSYLLANHKAVISDVRPGLWVEPDIFNAVQFTSMERFSQTCIHYIRDEEARRQLEKNAFIIMTQRDIRQILRTAFDA